MQMISVNYEQWYGEMVAHLETKDMTTSDAQGVIDGQHFVVDQAWRQGLTAVAAGDLVLQAAWVSQDS